MLDSIIGTFPTTNSSTFTQNVSTDTAATTTSSSKKRRSPDPEGNESQKQDEGPTVKRTRASAKKNQTTTELGRDSVFTPPDDPDKDALNEQDEVATGTKRQRTKRTANGSATSAQGSKTTASATRRKRGGKS
jgi:hypothetical protein